MSGEMPIDLQSTDDGVLLPVKAQAGARQNRSRGVHANSPRVAVTQVAEKGRANKAIVALLAMYVLLTMEFNSYGQPLVVMAVIPFGIVGAIWGHAIMGLPLTLFSMLGLVALTGVVVNDSIVLVDFINSRTRAGMPVHVAVVEAGKRRFRPVLLTSLTTIVGLLPILTETSFQAQLVIPMATSLCFGLLLSTLLVLVLVPTFYLIYSSVFGVRMTEQEAEVPKSLHKPEAAPAL